MELDTFKFIYFDKIPDSFEDDIMLMKYFNRFFQNAFINLLEIDEGFIMKYKEFVGLPGTMMGTSWMSFMEDNVDIDNSVNMFYMELRKDFKETKDNPVVFASHWTDVVPSFVPEYPDADADGHMTFYGIKNIYPDIKEQAWIIFKNNILNSPYNIVLHPEWKIINK